MYTTQDILNLAQALKALSDINIKGQTITANHTQDNIAKAMNKISKILVEEV